MALIYKNSHRCSWFGRDQCRRQEGAGLNLVWCRSAASLLTFSATVTRAVTSLLRSTHSSFYLLHAGERQRTMLDSLTLKNIWKYFLDLIVKFTHKFKCNYPWTLVHYKPAGWGHCFLSSGGKLHFFLSIWTDERAVHSYLRVSHFCPDFCSDLWTEDLVSRCHFSNFWEWVTLPSRGNLGLENVGQDSKLLACNSELSVDSWIREYRSIETQTSGTVLRLQL